jgi:thiol-disulfide isomerase/thioredoxin
LCLGLAGCSLFGKKSPARSSSPSGESATGPPGYRNDTAQTTLQANVSGILAGRVLDSYDQKPPVTYIQIISAGDKNGSKGNPVEVATDSQGFFTVHNLQPGQHYQLIARTRDQNPNLAGTVWATPPNPRLLIHISSDLASANTPPAPPPPGSSDRKTSPTNALPRRPWWEGPPAPADSPAPPKPAATQAGSQASGRAIDIGTPIHLNEENTNPPAGSTFGTQPRGDIRPEDISAAPRASTQDPVLNMTVPSSLPQEPTPSSIPQRPMGAPFCVLTGRQLDNFALLDLSGQPWEYRSHRGRLVLLDFWGTWCVYCLQSMPRLRILQDSYGRDGLEVIGIAYEDGTPAEQARKVASVRDRLQINYRLLLGSDMTTCPVKTQFRVTRFPTLILLDESNRIIWREEGLDDYRFQDLTMLIRQHLRSR